MKTLLITDNNNKEYKFNIDEDEYAEAIEMALANKGCATLYCANCPFSTEAAKGPAFIHFCDHVIDNVYWNNIKKVEILTEDEKKEMEEVLTFDKIKEELKKGDVTLVGDDKEYAVVGFSSAGSLVVEDLSELEVFAFNENSLSNLKIKGPEPKKFYKWVYKMRPDEVLRETANYYDDDCYGDDGRIYSVLASCVLKKKLLYTELTLEELGNECCNKTSCGTKRSFTSGCIK